MNASWGDWQVFEVEVTTDNARHQVGLVQNLMRSQRVAIYAGNIGLTGALTMLTEVGPPCLDTQDDRELEEDESASLPFYDPENGPKTWGKVGDHASSLKMTDELQTHVRIWREALESRTKKGQDFEGSLTAPCGGRGIPSRLTGQNDEGNPKTTDLVLWPHSQRWRTWAEKGIAQFTSRSKGVSKEVTSAKMNIVLKLPATNKIVEMYLGSYRVGRMQHQRI